MVAPLIPRLAAVFARSEQKVGVIVPAYLIPYGVSTLFYGLLSDRLGRRRIMLGSFAADLNGSTAPPSLTRQNQYASVISATIALSLKEAGFIVRPAAAGPSPAPARPWQTARIAVTVVLPGLRMTGRQERLDRQITHVAEYQEHADDNQRARMDTAMMPTHVVTDHTE